MKLLKVLTIVLFSIFLSFSVSYTQEKNTTDAGVKNLQQDISPGNTTGTEIEKTVSAEIKNEAVKVISDTANKKKTVVNENKSEHKKAAIKKSSEKKVAPVSVDVKEENSNRVKMDGDLLLINEGNFKYKRIPDIKLIDLKPEAAISNVQVVEVAKSGQNASTGFLGLSKTASDIIVKGGVLILILLIFILYKSRMSRPAIKSSKKRNVLNSYRK